MTPERAAFGPKLKAERDRRGISLQAIAESTKISISLLAALERNDMSRWPNGIFRRAFVREYVAALGLPSEPLLAEFVRLFPDGPCPEAAAVTEFRLTLESDPSAAWRAIRARALVAGVEVCGVVAVGSAAAWWFDAPLWRTCGTLALIYYPLAAVCLERALGPRLLFRPPGLMRWARIASTLQKKFQPLLPSPALSMRTPTTDGTENEGTAPEWRTASN